MDKSREQFEAWYKSKYLFQEYEFDRLKNGSYQWVESMWQTWQASRAVVEIELPEGVDTREALSRGFTCDYAAGMDQGIADCAEKIIEHGLKVKQ